MGPTKAIINHANLIHNFNLIHEAVQPAKVMAVVKANGYGHGAIEVAQTLLASGAEYLGVAFHEEGIELRKAGIDAPILVFGAQLSNFFIEHLEHDLDITLTSADQIVPLRELCKSQNKKARVQIKIDTGMRRVGFPSSGNLDTVFEILAEEWFDVIGIYSHLSSADEEDLGYTHGQVREFKKIRDQIQAWHSKPLLFHIANSAAIMRLPETYFDMVRPGVMLYGNAPSPGFKPTWPLKEVMQFVSKVSLLKPLAAGDAVSYNRRFYSDEDTLTAIIPVGYADGYNRRLTNTGSVIIRGKKYPVIGAVCMDQIVVNLGRESDIRTGDDVVLFGQQQNCSIPIMEICRQLQTIPYEVTCWVSGRVPRVHVNE